MFATAEEIAGLRQQSLNNLLSLSSTCLNAGEQFTHRLFAAGRQQLQQPATLAASPSVLGDALELMSQCQNSLICHLQIQQHYLDAWSQTLVARAQARSPFEIQPALACLEYGIATIEKINNELAHTEPAAQEN